MSNFFRRPFHSNPRSNRPAKRVRRKLSALSVESLEYRRVLAATPGTASLDAGVLTICGDDTDNTILIAEIGSEYFVAIADDTGAFTSTPTRFTRSEVNSIVITGGAGNDVITAATVTDGNVDIDGEAGNDIIFGSLAADTLAGGDGDDIIRGLLGDDTITGGLGVDTIYGGDGADTMTGDDGNDILVGDAGNDILSGSAGNDQIIGGLGADTLNGDDGDDTMDGGAGVDQMNGGAGDDILCGNLGDDQIDAGAGRDMVLGGLGGDNIIGGDDADMLLGGDGNDTVNGDGGEDTIYGGAGVDLLTGGAAGDMLHGGSGGDTLLGQAGDDELAGGTGADSLSGGAGDDNLQGGDDRDILIGGSGADGLDGNEHDDLLVSGSSSVESNQAALAALSTTWNSSDSYDDRISGVESQLGDSLSDDGGDDTLLGSGGTDAFMVSGGGDSTDSGATESVLGLELQAISDAYEATTNVTLTVDAASGVLANDSNPAGGDLNVDTTLVAEPTSGTVTMNPDGSFTYVPDADFQGSDFFTYRVANSAGSVSEASVTINVVRPNTAPIATDDSYTTDEDNPVSGSVVQNDSDNEGDSLSIETTPAAQPANGTVELLANGMFTYTPNADFNGSDEFRYTLTDGRATAIGTVRVTVEAVNDAPVVSSTIVSTNTNVTLDIDAADGVLDDATDAEGDALTAVLETDVSNGSLTLNADGSYTYVPATDFTGVDSFSFRANDGTVDSEVATVTINILEPTDVTLEGFDIIETAARGNVVGFLGNRLGAADSATFELRDDNIPELLRLVEDDHLSGLANAPMVLVDYLDFGCPACLALHQQLEGIKQQFGDDLLVVTRHFITTPNGEEAARYAEAAARQDQFDEMVDLLFDNQGDWNGVSDPTSFLDGYASSLGLDMGQLATDLADPALLDGISENINSGTTLGATSTPTVFLNGERVANVSTLSDEIQSDLDAFDNPFLVDRLTGAIAVGDNSTFAANAGGNIQFIVDVTDGDDEQSVRVVVDIVEAVVGGGDGGADPT